MKGGRNMLTMIVMFALLCGVIKMGVRLAWGSTKFLFGLGLFWLCPVLFVLAVLVGAFSHLWLPILIIGLLCGGGFRRGLPI